MRGGGEDEQCERREGEKEGGVRMGSGGGGGDENGKCAM